MSSFALPVESDEATDLVNQAFRLWNTKRYGYSQVNSAVQSQGYDAQGNRMAQTHHPFASPAGGCTRSSSEA